ncbi:NAD(P)-dependent oxidoreductase [Rubrivivax sp. RP6-9]|uniref:NAD(P)-dependent oxidoreductase n=1 Tax=Rubrivivax sp. RP6-9 TaxID=3415750 RepID=UPI003CC6CE87
MSRIVVSQPIHAEVLARLQSAGEVVMNPGPEPWDAERLASHLGAADAWMAFMTDRIDATMLARAPRLRAVACALKGYDNFDLAACARAGVQVSFVPDLLTEPTAELAVGLAIAAARHLLDGDRRVRAGYAGWRPALYGTGLHGSTVAVVGLGAVGRAIVDRLQGFGCAEILGVDPAQRDARTRAAGLREAMQQAHYVLLAVPLTPSSRHLIDARTLADARPGQLLVNVGRGSVVDEQAVCAALESGRLGAYAADVFELEDWRLPDRPGGIPQGLLQHPRTVFTPHLGSAVRDVRRAIEMRAAENLVAALAGEAVADLASSVSASY